MTGSALVAAALDICVSDLSREPNRGYRSDSLRIYLTRACSGVGESPAPYTCGGNSYDSVLVNDCDRSIHSPLPLSVPEKQANRATPIFDYLLALRCCPSEIAVDHAEDLLERDLPEDYALDSQTRISRELRIHGETGSTSTYLSPDHKVTNLVDPRVLRMDMCEIGSALEDLDSRPHQFWATIMPNGADKQTAEIQSGSNESN
jgi:hypothetical protein